MKKQFVIFLVLALILGLTPINFSLAITQNQINAEVQIVCTDGTDKWFSGSGTIIDPKGIILTNRHVVEGAYKNVCFIGFLESINQEPNFGTKENPNIAEVKYITSTADMDAAVLYLNNIDNKTYPYINIWDSNSSDLKFGDKIEVVGYPSIGGSTITYTSGDFSGFGSKTDGTQNYIKATTPLEHGNSGGASYNSSGLFVGIPTMVVAGPLNSLSYVLSVNSIKNWLSNILGTQYQQQIIEIKPMIENPNVSLQSDIIPPEMFSADKIIFHSNETGKNIGWNNIYEDDSNLTIKWPDASDESRIDGYYVYFGTNRNANPVSDGVYIKEKNYNSILNIPGIYFVIISARDKNGNISAPVIAQYNYKVYAEWITKDPLQYLLVTNRPTHYYIYDYSNGKKGKLLKDIKFDSSKVQNIKVPSNNILVEWNGASNKNLITNQEAFFDKGRAWDKCGGPSWNIWEEQRANNISLNEAEIKQKNWDKCMKGLYVKAYNNTFYKTNLEINKSYNFEYQFYYNYDNKENISSGLFNPFVLTATKQIIYRESDSFMNRVKGKILLQVESSGEAWYINPQDGKRYYMADGNKAYNVMRNLGVGITNNNLAKIKIDKNLAKKFSGKIFLQVEDKGEAYYIDFNGVAHYLKDGDAAYTIMRELGLGIKNNDLSKIDIGEIN